MDFACYRRKWGWYWADEFRRQSSFQNWLMNVWQIVSDNRFSSDIALSRQVKCVVASNTIRPSSRLDWPPRTRLSIRCKRRSLPTDSWSACWNPRCRPCRSLCPRFDCGPAWPHSCSRDCRSSSWMRTLECDGRLAQDWHKIRRLLIKSKEANHRISNLLELSGQWLNGLSGRRWLSLWFLLWSKGMKWSLVITDF